MGKVQPIIGHIHDNLDVLMDKQILRCYLVAGTQDCVSLPEYTQNPKDALLKRLEEALRQGITCYQFREKGARALQDPIEIEKLARECQTLCRHYHVPFIINNDMYLAKKLQSDGIHIGQNDTPVAELSHHLSHQMLIGLSVNTLAQAKQHQETTAIDYYGCGPIFPTNSKSDASPAVGISFITTLRQHGITKPLVAIGGIKVRHVEALHQAGVDGIAVISTIMQSENIAQTIQQLLKI